jgi:hypothetical protein
MSGATGCCVSGIKGTRTAEMIRDYYLPWLNTTIAARCLRCGRYSEYDARQYRLLSPDRSESK